MKKLSEVYRLKFELGYSNRIIAGSLGISSSTVSEYVRLFNIAGLVWEQAKWLPYDELEQAIYHLPQRNNCFRPKPDFTQIHLAYKKKGVTLLLLWKEYKQQYADGFGYTHFCVEYRKFAKTLEPVMRFSHKAGEKCFVDYSGLTMEWIDAHSGEIHQAEIFVGCLGASHFIYCEATASQALVDWTGSHVRMFEFFGGVPESIVPDNLKAGVQKPHRYDPDINPTYTLLAEHYGVAVLPARVRHPRDKSKVEVAVQCIEREIIAPLRHQTFSSLAEINAAIQEKLALLNQRPMQKINLSRQQQFEQLEKPVLKPLPRYRFELQEWKHAKVHLDYHVSINKHFYSVPYTFIGKKVNVCLTKHQVEIFFAEKRIALHQRNDKTYGFTTCNAHMPENHQHYLEQQHDSTVERQLAWAKSHGTIVHEYIRQFFQARHLPQQAIRAVLGLQRLAKQYGQARFEKACQEAMRLRHYRFKTIEEILKHELDKPRSTVSSTYQASHCRGKEYFS